MPTRSCLDCAHPVSENAATCPHCGHPFAQQREQQYTALVNIRNTELTAYWTRYNIQAVLNLGFAALAISALVQLKGPFEPNKVLVKILFAVAGFILAAIWLGFTVQGKKLFVDGWEEWIAEYEDKWLRAQDTASISRPGLLLFYQLKEEGAASPIHPNAAKRKDRLSSSKRLRAWFAWENLNFLARSLPVLFIAAWLSFLLYTCWNEHLK